MRGLLKVDWYCDAEADVPPKLVGMYGKEEEAVGEGLTYVDRVGLEDGSELVRDDLLASSEGSEVEGVDVDLDDFLLQIMDEEVELSVGENISKSPFPSIFCLPTSPISPSPIASFADRFL